MNNTENYLINYLEDYNHVDSSKFGSPDRRIRALMNITMPEGLSDEFYEQQDNYLQSRYAHLPINDSADILGSNSIALFQGDITTIKADAITNACNNALLGCFSPLHSCIDNAIHSFGGLEIRRDLIPIMAQQNNVEPSGHCKVTKGYNLPASYIFHTVGPICYNNNPTMANILTLTSCYKECLKMADSMHLKTLVFCSISTGVYGFPIEKASRIAVSTVKEYLNSHTTSLKVIFNVFSDYDRKVYEQCLKN